MPLVLPFSTSFKRIAILGGGVTGLTAAYQLARLGHTVRMFEVRDRVGGTIRTETKDGWLVELGPAALRESGPPITILLQSIGAYKHRLEAAPVVRRRYLVRRGKLRAAPRNAFETAISPLIPFGTKLRGLAEIFRRSQQARPERAFGELVRRQLGPFAADVIAQAFAAGIYLGDAEKLSARYAFPRYWDMWCSHGSFVRAQMDHIRRCYERNEFIEFPVISFTRGMQTLVHGLTLQLPADTIVPHARVEGLVPGPRWHVIWRNVRGQPNAATAEWSADDDTGRQVEGFDMVVSTLPGHALARIAVGDRSAHPFEALGGIPYAPRATLFLGFRRDQVRHSLKGFGLIAPPGERRSIVGVTFTSSLFPGRAPEGHVALTVTVGGMFRPELAALPFEELVSAVMPDLRQLLGIAGHPVFARHSAWPRDVPQYNVGYGGMLQTMIALERANPGLFIGGRVRDGVSIAQSLLSGIRLADRACMYSPD